MSDTTARSKPKEGKNVESTERQPSWVLVPWVIAFLMGLFSVSASLCALPRSSIRIPRTDNNSLSPNCPTPEPHAQSIVCFVNYVSAVPGFTKAHIPTHLCHRVVLCCLSDITENAVGVAMRQAAELRAHVKSAATYMGFGGPDLDYSHLSTWFSSGARRVVDVIVRTVRRAGYTGGAAVMIADSRHVDKLGSLQTFSAMLLQDLRRAAGHYSLVLLVPAQPGTESRLFSPHMLALDGMVPIMLSHVTEEYNADLKFATCSTPTNAARFVAGAQSVSLEAAFVKARDDCEGSAWPVLERKIGFSFSLAWSEFLQRDLEGSRDAGIPAMYQGPVSYSSVCKKNLGIHRRTFRDYRTDCQVISDGGQRWYSGLGEEASRFLRTHFALTTIGVFDIEFEDFNGTCRGLRYPQLQALHDVLRQIWCKNTLNS
ncbi:unnamed protein product [Ixodes hexagonus]